MTRVLSAVLCALAIASAAAAQSAPLQLSLADAVKRGLEKNLAVIVQEQKVQQSNSARLQALSALLPHVSADFRESRQIVNLAAFGFTGFGGLEIPNLIGPFNVVDARVSASAPVLDLAASHELKAASSLQTAAQADYRTTRETVVLIVGSLYLQALADQARLASADAQVTTADALVRLAEDQHNAGIVAEIDVLRQQVQSQAARSQQIAARTALANHKLQLARAIGLAADQPIELTTASAMTPLPLPSLDQAARDAATHRADLASARARLEAARQDRSAVSASRLPGIDVDADVGALGNTASTAQTTYTIAANVRVPIFNGNKTRADILRTDALLHEREAELADLETGVRFDIASALLTVEAAEAAVNVAKSAADLSRTALTQAEDRFRAGVASTIEVVQAQEAVARASEQYISSLYTHAVAAAGLAKAMGVVEEKFVSMVGG